MAVETWLTVCMAAVHRNLAQYRELSSPMYFEWLLITWVLWVLDLKKTYIQHIYLSYYMYNLTMPLPPQNDVEKQLPTHPISSHNWVIVSLPVCKQDHRRTA